jgi:hypothetical protein
MIATRMESKHQHLRALEGVSAVVEPALELAALVVDSVVPDDRCDEAEAVGVNVRFPYCKLI